MNYEKLDKKAILSWRIERIISIIVLGVLLVIGIMLIENANTVRAYLNYAYWAAGLIFLYLLTGLAVYPEIEYRQWCYVITEDKVEIRHGIFFITTTVIPIVRIQHITISRGPIYRRLGLSKVKIFLASGSFDIEGLSERTADKISEYLKSRVLERLDRDN